MGIALLSPLDSSRRDRPAVRPHGPAPADRGPLGAAAGDRAALARLRVPAAARAVRRAGALAPPARDVPLPEAALDRRADLDPDALRLALRARLRGRAALTRCCTRSSTRPSSPPRCWCGSRCSSRRGGACRASCGRSPTSPARGSRACSSGWRSWSSRRPIYEGFYGQPRAPARSHAGRGPADRRRPDAGSRLLRDDRRAAVLLHARRRRRRSGEAAEAEDRHARPAPPPVSGGEVGLG